MRAGVYPNAGCLGRPWLLRLSSSQMESKCYSERPCAVQRAACTAARCRGLCAGRPVCPGESDRLHCVCGRVCSRVCKARGRPARKDGGTALIPAAGLTRRRPVCGRTQRPLLEGRRHRGTDPPAPLGEAGTQRGTAATHRGSSTRCPGEALCPCEELQPGRAACDALTALRSAVSEDRGGTRARQGTGLWTCTHPLLRPVQDSVRHPARL